MQYKYVCLHIYTYKHVSGNNSNTQVCHAWSVVEQAVVQSAEDLLPKDGLTNLKLATT